MSSKTSLMQYLQKDQLEWLDRYIPDWWFWRDDFRTEVHLYTKTEVSKNILLLGNIIFKQTTPSHYPLGDNVEWWKND